MRESEQSELSSGILRNLEALALVDPGSHKDLLGEIVAQAGRVNEPGYVSVVCPVLADTLKSAEIVPWIRRMQDQIAAGRNGDALETLSELEEWLSRLWRLADPLCDWSIQTPARTKSCRKRLSAADLQFLKLIGVSAGSKQSRIEPNVKGK